MLFSWNKKIQHIENKKGCILEETISATLQGFHYFILRETLVQKIKEEGGQLLDDTMVHLIHLFAVSGLTVKPKLAELQVGWLQYCFTVVWTTHEVSLVTTCLLFVMRIQ